MRAILRTGEVETDRVEAFSDGVPAMFLAACRFSLMQFYAGFIGRLIRPHITREALRRAMRRSLIGPVTNGVGGIAAVTLPRLSPPAQIVVPLIYFLPGHAGQYETIERQRGDSCASRFWAPATLAARWAKDGHAPATPSVMA